MVKMEKKSACFYLLLGGTLFFHIILTAVPAEYVITCPNAQQQFECGGPRRTGQSTIKFEFVGQHNPGWTNIQLNLSASLPVANPRIPVLDVVPPIELYYQKD